MISILIIEDSKVIRANLKSILEELGYKNIIEASDGKSAINSYIRFTPELIFLDISIPHRSGLEVLKEIKKINKNTKVIMATTSGEEKIVMQAIASGANSYLLKPITYDKVKDKISKVFPNSFDIDRDINAYIKE